MSGAGSEPIDGRCLCGAVTIRLSGHRPEVSACHCIMCQRWTGGAYFMFTAEPEEMTVTGEVARYRSSSFSERAFCPTCGSHLWLRDDTGPVELMPGLFEAARSFPLISEIYVDRRLAAVRLEGNHRRATRAEYEAKHPFVEEGDLQ